MGHAKNQEAIQAVQAVQTLLKHEMDAYKSVTEKFERLAEFTDQDIGTARATQRVQIEKLQDAVTTLRQISSLYEAAPAHTTCLLDEIKAIFGERISALEHSALELRLSTLSELVEELRSTPVRVVCATDLDSETMTIVLPSTYVSSHTLSSLEKSLCTTIDREVEKVNHSTLVGLRYPIDSYPFEESARIEKLLQDPLREAVFVSPYYLASHPSSKADETRQTEHDDVTHTSAIHKAVISVLGEYTGPVNLNTKFVNSVMSLAGTTKHYPSAESKQDYIRSTLVKLCGDGVVNRMPNGKYRLVKDG